MADVLMCVLVLTLVAQNLVELLGIDIIILAAHVCDERVYVCVIM